MANRRTAYSVAGLDDSAVLDDLQKACLARHYGVRQAPFFASGGLCIFKASEVDGISVMERGVYVFRHDGTWHLLVNWHNPPQLWIKRVTDASRLATLVAAVVEGDDSPPEGWIRE